MAPEDRSPPLSSLLANVRIVLVEPQYGGNVGACARAMLNTGLSRMLLVAPREHLTAESYWMARDAKGILEGAEVFPSLGEALSTVTLAIGTTRREGKYRRPAMTPREAAMELLPRLATNEVAYVFGREDSGLSGEALDRCQWVVTIPANETFPSLNLAQAVLICGYELFVAVGEEAAGARMESEVTSSSRAKSSRLAGPDRLERFYSHLEEVLREIRFLVGDQAPSIFRTLKRIFGRANLEPRDLKILHGVLAQMDWYRRRVEAELAPTAEPSTPESSDLDRAAADRIRVRRARQADWPLVIELLSAAELPVEGLAEHREHLFIAVAAIGGAGEHDADIEGVRIHVLTAPPTPGGTMQDSEGKKPAGCVAVETYEGAALLRSLAVAPDERGHGVGRRLVAEALAEARRSGARSVFLLTRTAAEFFARLGFERIAREDVPSSIHASAEWMADSCRSAVAMRLTF